MLAMVQTEVDFVSDTRDKLLAYIAETNRKQAPIARELDVSQTMLSQFLNGVYSGNNEELARKINQFLVIGAVRKAITKTPDISLAVSNTKKILRSVHNAHVSSDILLVYGPAGCGKTTALKHYCNNTSGVVYVEADVTMNTHRAILTEILDKLGENQHGSTNILMRRLITRLQGTNKLIIVDEAQHLTEKSLDAIRALNDKADVGIVFSGNTNILKRMYGCKAVDLDQVYSRIGWHCELDNKYNAEDIASIFDEAQLCKGSLEYLHKVSKRKGGLRLMVKQYKLAANIALTLNQDLSVIHLEEAARRMGMGGVS